MDAGPKNGPVKTNQVSLPVVIQTTFDTINFLSLFYYSVYFYYYLWILLYFLVLFMSYIVLFQLTFIFIYNTFSKKFSISTK